MMWLSAFITNMWWPGLFIVIVSAITAVVILVTGFFTREHEEIGSEKWILGAMRIRLAAKIAIATAIFGCFVFATPTVDYQTKTVYVDRVVVKMPPFKERLDNCYQNNHGSGMELRLQCIDYIQKEDAAMRGQAVK